MSVAIIAVIGGVYHTVEPEKQPFLDITDYTITQQKDGSLFLSVTTSEEIPRLLESSMGYGYGWFESGSEKLFGYTVNIHKGSTPQWHAESVTINDSAKFCFDEVDLVLSNVVIDQSNLNVIVSQGMDVGFDRIMSYEITSDHNCHTGLAGKVVDKIIVK